MNNQPLPPDDLKLHALLAASRSAPDLPAGFSNSVWRRIARAETGSPTPVRDWLDWLAGCLLRPRLAMAVATVAVGFGVVFGSWQGVSFSNQAAQARYLAAVSPQTLRY